MIHIIYNDHSGSFSPAKLQEIKHWLEIHHVAHQFHQTKKRKDAEDFARNLSKTASDSDVICGFGGDGTLNEIAQGLAMTQIPMGIIPGGTTNVLCKELKIPNQPVEALEICIQRKTSEISLGKVSFLNRDSQEWRYFILMAGIGLDASVCKNVSLNLKKISGKGAYVFESLKEIILQNPQEFDLQTQEKAYLSIWCVLCNARFYGGNFILNPRSSLFSDTLAAFSVSPVPKSSFIKLFPKLLSGTHEKNKNVVLFENKSISIFKPGIPVQLDGDYIANTPATFELCPKALRICIP